MTNLHYIHSEIAVIFSDNFETHQICRTVPSVP